MLRDSDFFTVTLHCPESLLFRQATFRKTRFEVTTTTKKAKHHRYIFTTWAYGCHKKAFKQCSSWAAGWQNIGKKSTPLGSQHSTNVPTDRTPKCPLADTQNRQKVKDVQTDPTSNHGRAREPDTEASEFVHDAHDAQPRRHGSKRRRQKWFYVTLVVGGYDGVHSEGFISVGVDPYIVSGCWKVELLGVESFTYLLFSHVVQYWDWSFPVELAILVWYHLVYLGGSNTMWNQRSLFFCILLSGIYWWMQQYQLSGQYRRCHCESESPNLTQQNRYHSVLEGITTGITMPIDNEVNKQLTYARATDAPVETQ